MFWVEIGEPAGIRTRDLLIKSRAAARKWASRISALSAAGTSVRTIAARPLSATGRQGSRRPAFRQASGQGGFFRGVRRRVALGRLRPPRRVAALAEP